MSDRGRVLLIWAIGVLLIVLAVSMEEREAGPEILLIEEPDQ